MTQQAKQVQPSRPRRHPIPTTPEITAPSVTLPPGLAVIGVVVLLVSLVWLWHRHSTTQVQGATSSAASSVLTLASTTATVSGMTLASVGAATITDSTTTGSSTSATAGIVSVGTATVAATSTAATATAASLLSLGSTPAAAPASTAAIAATVKTATKSLQGTYGVWVDDLDSGTTFGQNDHTKFIAASVIKAFILTALYEEEAKGEISLTETMTTSSSDIQNFGTGSIRYDPVGTTYTLAELARRMAKQSDNTAAYMLTKRLGQQAIQDRIAAWGMTNTSVADDTTTPADVGTLFVKLGKRQLLPPSQTVAVLGLLTDTDFEDRLPALLPNYAIIAHKIGTESNGVINDAGLVITPTRSYAIAIMTTGTDVDQAIHAEQQVSLDVYNFELTLP